MYDTRGVAYATKDLFIRVGLCDLKEAIRPGYEFFGDC